MSSTGRYRCYLCGEEGEVTLKLEGRDVVLCRKHWLQVCELLTKLSYTRGTASLQDIVLEPEKGGVKLREEVKLVEVIPRRRCKELKNLLRPEEVPENYYEIMSEE